jgi:hypothetical protein
MKVAVSTVARQPSWIVRSRDVEVAITQRGGHMAPVVFDRKGKRPIRPYYVSPWQGERRKIDTPVLVPLRGDFFCMPFGGVNEYRGESHTPHGEPATARWKLVGAERKAGVTRLTLSMQTEVRPGRVTKIVRLADGDPAVYVQHVLEGYSGPMPLGHHATLAVPAEPGAMRVAGSAFQLGMTNPTLFSDPAAGEYQSLAIHRRFRDLSRVPLIRADEKFGDCTAFPTRKGFTDLLAIYKRPSRDPAWMTATVARRGYLWFSLKDAAVLPATVFWISNGGRHGPPWNGRNRCLGLEDVCAYFAEGLTRSARRNEITEAGFPTAVRLSPAGATVINYIEGAVRVPRGFGAVESVRFAPGKVTFLSAAGAEVAAPVRHEFLSSGEL